MLDVILSTCVLASLCPWISKTRMVSPKDEFADESDSAKGSDVDSDSTKGSVLFAAPFPKQIVMIPLLLNESIEA
jgi:hypothetical protein